MVPPQRLPARHQPHPQAARRHRTPRRLLLNPDGSEAEWPAADVIVGNPPFLGGSVMRGELGDDYVETLRKTYDGRVPGGADLVTYWFEKARAQIAAGKLQAAGLVSTNSIRGGANRKVLERIVDTTRIFEAWSDEEWINDGAAVRVSLFGFGPIFPVDRSNRLDGAEVAAIHADLTAGEGINLTLAKRLPKMLSSASKASKNTARSTFRVKPRALGYPPPVTQTGAPTPMFFTRGSTPPTLFATIQILGLSTSPDCPSAMQRCTKRHFSSRLKMCSPLAPKTETPKPVNNGGFTSALALKCAKLSRRCHVSL
jgi:hypothetical protein